MLYLSGDIAGLLTYAEVMCSMDHLKQKLNYLNTYGRRGGSDFEDYDVHARIVNRTKRMDVQVHEQEWEVELTWVNPSKKTYTTPLGEFKMCGGLIPHGNTWGVHT